ncbi:MAG: hypothetical protein M1817_001314 [Caeruleum heppii]|nr:MAG: hypothetical protein M1817_001314 [Caeruleum heppii]
MGTLSYDLNITKKGGAPKPAPARRKAIFDDDSDGDDGTPSNNNGVEDIGGILAAPPPPRKSSPKTAPDFRKPSKTSNKPAVSVYGDLSSNLTSSKHGKDAASLDPSIYEYDAAFDSLHAAKKIRPGDDPTSRQPKYMASLLAAAEVRKRDQLRAKEKLLVKEREAEGDEFADKDKFVTGAYKKQQEEVKRLEEEERKKEEEDARRNKGKGMMGFYRDVLERGEQKHEEAVTAVENAKMASVQGAPEPELGQTKDKSEEELARELQSKGQSIALNDEGQIVDKRQLLSAGLNVAPKPAATSSSAASSGTSRPGAQPAYQGKSATQRAMRERQTRMLEEQLAQASKRAADDEDERQKELERAAKTRKTEGEISGARERYLQRKREAEEAKKKGIP